MLRKILGLSAVALALVITPAQAQEPNPQVMKEWAATLYRGEWQAIGINYELGTVTFVSDWYEQVGTVRNAWLRTEWRQQSYADTKSMVVFVTFDCSGRTYQRKEFVSLPLNNLKGEGRPNKFYDSPTRAFPGSGMAEVLTHLCARPPIIAP